MNQEAKKLWLDELKAVEQARGCLRDGNRFCVAGALCNAYVKETGKLHWHYDWLANYDRSWVAVPPLEVIEWAEIPTALLDNLMGLNDGGTGFEKLAKMIEEEA